MKNKNLITLVAFSLFLFSCKTSEDIRKEQLLDTVSVQITNHQKQLADNSYKIQEMDQRVNQVYGQLEETQHEKKKEILEKEQERVRTLSEVTDRLSGLEKRLVKLEESLGNQKKFIEDATDTLKSLRKPQASSDDYLKGMREYKKKNYKSAFSLLEPLLSEKKTSSVRKVRIKHVLGIISYQQKNYDKALIYLSKIYTKYPRSSKAPSALLYIARSFQATGQKAKATETLDQLLKEYPKSSLVSDAKELKAKL